MVFFTEPRVHSKHHQLSRCWKENGFEVCLSGEGLAEREQRSLPWAQLESGQIREPQKQGQSDHNCIRNPLQGERRELLENVAPLAEGTDLTVTATCHTVAVSSGRGWSSRYSGITSFNILLQVSSLRPKSAGYIYSL